MSKSWQHRYTNKLGQPLQKCPACGHDLAQEEDGVLVGLVTSVRGYAWTESATLDEEGRLVNEDAAKGQHSYTACAGCGELLIDLDGVTEEIWHGDERRV